MAVNQIQTLINLVGSVKGQTDPVSISENPLLTITTPSVTSGGLVSTSGLDQEVIATGDETAFLFVKNSGLNGAGTGTNITAVTLSAGTSFASLKVGEFAFLPLVKGAGAKIKFISGQDANVTYAVFTRA
jgi:hypothetical protein